MVCWLCQSVTDGEFALASLMQDTNFNDVIISFSCKVIASRELYKLQRKVFQVNRVPSLCQSKFRDVLCSLWWPEWSVKRMLILTTWLPDWTIWRGCRVWGGGEDWMWMRQLWHSPQSCSHHFFSRDGEVGHFVPEVLIPHVMLWTLIQGGGLGPASICCYRHSWLPRGGLILSQQWIGMGWGDREARERVGGGTSIGMQN